MHQEVFKSSFLSAVIVPTIIAIGLFSFYYYITSKHGSFPVWTLLLLFIPIILAIEGQSKKLIVEGDTIRYKRIFPIRRDDMVSLHDVYGFKADYIVSNTDDSSTKVIYIIDRQGDLIFSFPGSLLRNSNINRFKTAILAINPDIIIE